MTNLADKPRVREVEEDLKGRLAAWQIRHRDFVPLSMAVGRNARQRRGAAGATPAVE